MALRTQVRARYRNRRPRTVNVPQQSRFNAVNARVVNNGALYAEREMANTGAAAAMFIETLRNRDVILSMYSEDKRRGRSGRRVHV